MGHGGSVSSDSERKVRVAEVALRCLLCGLGALAAALVATDAQTRTFFGLRKKAAFTDVTALVVLVAADAVAAGYSLLHLAARCLLLLPLSSSSSSVPVPPLRETTSSSSNRSSRVLMLAWCVFSCDQALAYATLAAAAAALQASVVSKRGVPEFQWMQVCGMYGAFCRRAGAGVAGGLAAGLAAGAVAVLSAFNLFRLYGDNNKSGGTSARRNGGATTSWQ